MSGTPRLSLPFLSPGQAQKEFTHNEALQTLDVLVAGAVEEGPRSDPPASPLVGTAFIVGSAPTGAWAGKPQCVAAYTEGGWRFIPAVDGMDLYVKSNETSAAFRAGAWEIGRVRASQVMVNGQQVVGPRGAAIAAATGGTSVDTEARATIAEVLGVLRDHGLIEP